MILVCSEFNDGRIAVIGIGNSQTLEHIKAISNSLDVPFIKINWNKYDDEYSKLKDNETSEESLDNSQEINLHPSSIKITEAIIDLVYHYNWEYITILYQESIGLDRIQHLLNIPRLRTPFSDKYRVDVRQLSKDTSSWIYLLKDIKLKGSSHIIVDIEPYYLNQFVRQV